MAPLLPSAPDPAAKPAPQAPSSHKPAERKNMQSEFLSDVSLQSDTIMISGFTRDLLCDVCAFAQHLLHNNLESFAQEELAL